MYLIANNSDFNASGDVSILTIKSDVLNTPHRIPFTIEFEELEWSEYCPMLGIKLEYFTKGRCDNSVSFDRINPLKGYIQGNVIICSDRANRIKNNGTAEELLKIANYLFSINSK